MGKSYLREYEDTLLSASSTKLQIIGRNIKTKLMLCVLCSHMSVLAGNDMEIFALPGHRKSVAGLNQEWKTKTLHELRKERSKSQSQVAGVKRRATVLPTLQTSMCSNNVSQRSQSVLGSSNLDPVESVRSSSSARSLSSESAKSSSNSSVTDSALPPLPFIPCI